MGFITLKKPLFGYKKVKIKRSYGVPHHLQRAIVYLKIPAGARVYCDQYGIQEKSLHLSTRKMRASEARVLGVWYYDNVRNAPVKVKGKFSTRPLSLSNTYGKAIDYVPGKIVKPHEFSAQREQCSGGIHFFTSYRKARWWY